VPDGRIYPREQVVNRLREAGFKFHKRTPNTEIYKNGVQRVFLTKRKALAEVEVRTVLSQAGLTVTQTEKFLKDVVKDC
jgi:hypothetical protein